MTRRLAISKEGSISRYERQALSVFLGGVGGGEGMGECSGSLASTNSDETVRVRRPGAVAVAKRLSQGDYGLRL